MASPVTEERGSPFPARTVGPSTGTTRMSQAVGALRAASEGGRPRVAPRCSSGGERGVEPAPWPPRRAAPRAAPPAPHGPRPAPPVHLDLSCCPRPGAVAPAPGSRCGPSPATRSRPAGQWDAHSGLDEAPSTWGTPLARGVGNLWGGPSSHQHRARPLGAADPGDRPRLPEGLRGAPRQTRPSGANIVACGRVGGPTAAPRGRCRAQSGTRNTVQAPSAHVVWLSLGGTPKPWTSINSHRLSVIRGFTKPQRQLRARGRGRAP